MLTPADKDLIDRFHDRLAGIESDVPSVAPVLGRRVRSGIGTNGARMPSLLAFGGLVAAVVAIIGLPLLDRPTPRATPPAEGGSVTTAPGDARSGLLVATEWEALIPPGVDTFGQPWSIRPDYRLRLSNAADDEIQTWKLSTAMIGGRFDPGTYDIVVWRVAGTPLPETIRPVPVGETAIPTTQPTATPTSVETIVCSVRVTLAPGTVTHFTLSLPYGGEPCSFGPPEVSDTPSTWADIPSGSPVDLDARPLLSIELLRERIPLPSGVSFGGALGPTYFVRLATTDDPDVATWRLDRAPSGGRFAPGTYRVTAWSVDISDNADTGARQTSAPFARCSTQLDLGTGTTTKLTITVPPIPTSCSFSAPEVAESAVRFPEIPSGSPADFHAPAALRVTGTILGRCGSIGGCVYDATLKGPDGTTQAGFDFSRPDVETSLDLGLPVVLPAGEYVATFRSRMVSDSIVNGVRQIGPEDARCSVRFVVGPTNFDVQVRVTFDRGACQAVAEVT